MQKSLNVGTMFCPSQEKDLHNHMATNGSTLYKLRTAILHKDKNLTYGHYSDVIIYDDTKILKVFLSKKSS